MNVDDDEKILADAAVGLFRGLEVVGGRLKITTRRLLFEPHAVNLQKNSAEILLSDIAIVGERNTFGIIPNGFFIRTSFGVLYKFVAFRRRRLIALIEDQLRQNRADQADLD